MTTLDEASTTLGIPPSDSITALQTDSFKELVNKFAWCLGSTYRVDYSNVRTAARTLAIQMASHVIRTQGYPRKISKPEINPRNRR